MVPTFSASMHGHQHVPCVHRPVDVCSTPKRFILFLGIVGARASPPIELSTIELLRISSHPACFAKKL